MNISTSSLVGPSLSCQVPVKPYCTHTCVLKKAGQVGREMWEFISLLVGSAHGWVYSAADIRAKPEKSTMKNFSSPRKPSYLYMHPKEVQQRQCVCRERYYKKSHWSTGLSSTVGQCEGHIPRVTHGGGLSLTLPTLGRSRWLDVDVALLLISLVSWSWTFLE